VLECEQSLPANAYSARAFEYAPLPLVRVILRDSKSPKFVLINFDMLSMPSFDVYDVGCVTSAMKQLCKHSSITSKTLQINKNHVPNIECIQVTLFNFGHSDIKFSDWFEFLDGDTQIKA